jgi:hypothetical protein
VEQMMIRRSIAFAMLVIVAVVGSLAGSAIAQESPAQSWEIPGNLVPPSDSALIFELYAQGDQIYACEANPEDASQYVWTFKRPEAELFNASGETVGRHFAGPTWQGHDGSVVAGQVIERAASPDEGSIPWLLLGAKYNAGNGVFSTITYILRLDTVGGVAPADGCDADHAGAEVRQPYQATYALYYPATPLGLSPVE